MIKAGRTRRAPSLALVSRPNLSDAARFAVIAPKRFLRRAVDRNRAKRLLREWFRLNQSELSGQDILVRIVARPAALEDLSGQLCDLLAKRKR